MHGGMVDTERAETAAVSRGASRVTTKQRCISTPLGWILKKRAKTTTTLIENQMRQERSEFAREQSTALYKSDQQQQQPHTHTHTHTHTRQSFCSVFITNSWVTIEVRRISKTFSGFCNP